MSPRTEGTVPRSACGGDIASAIDDARDEREMARMHAQR